MLPSKEECDKKLQQLVDYYKTDNEVYYLTFTEANVKNAMEDYAKWYAEQVIKHCAEVAICTIPNEFDMGEELPYEVNKQSILNVIQEL